MPWMLLGTQLIGPAAWWQLCAGYSGSDMAHLVREASMVPMREALKPGAIASLRKEDVRPISRQVHLSGPADHGEGVHVLLSQGATYPGDLSHSHVSWFVLMRCWARLRCWKLRGTSEPLLPCNSCRTLRSLFQRFDHPLQRRSSQHTRTGTSSLGARTWIDSAR